MANINRRLTGRFGQIWLQIGSTAVAGPTSCNGNAAAEVIDDITYDAYQVWTNSVAGNIPMDPQTIPVVTVGGSGLPAAYTYDIDYLRGKAIFTPSLGASATVSFSTYATPKLFAVGDMEDWGIDVTTGIVDSTVAMKTWEEKMIGYKVWSGSANFFYKNTSWWSQAAESAGGYPAILRFYPAKTVGTEYWLGHAIVDWGIKGPKADGLKQAIKFSGTGSLIYKAS